MKLIIDIDEEVYKRNLAYKNSAVIESTANDLSILTHAIANGTPTIGCYEQGYNAAKREIALSGEYQRAYNRGYEQACKDKIDTPYKEAE